MRKDHPDGPPPGWSKESKASWPSLPAEVREAVQRFEEEADDHFAQYAGLKQFRDSATERGTTLEAQLAEWTRIEDVLRADLASGILFVSRRLAKELAFPTNISRGGPANSTPASRTALRLRVPPELNIERQRHEPA